MLLYYLYVPYQSIIIDVPTDRGAPIYGIMRHFQHLVIDTFCSYVVVILNETDLRVKNQIQK